MARKQSSGKSVASATLPSGTNVTASQEVIDKVTGKQPTRTAKKAAASDEK